MEIYSTENEQLDAVRHFFRENGKAIVLGLILGAGGLFGWNYWQSHKSNTAMEASIGFERIATALATGQPDVEAQVNSFIQANPNTYGVMAALLSVQQLVDAGDFTAAEKQLFAAQKSTSDANLQSLINLRLARVQLQQKQYDAALASLDKVKGNSWLAQAQDIRGDIYMDQGKIDAARAAYSKGLELNPSQAISALLQMKISNIAA